MDYAEIDRLPVILFFKNRVLKGEVVGFEPDQIVGVLFLKKPCHGACMGLIKAVFFC